MWRRGDVATWLSGVGAAASASAELHASGGEVGQQSSTVLVAQRTQQRRQQPRLRAGRRAQRLRQVALRVRDACEGNLHLNHSFANILKLKKSDGPIHKKEIFSKMQVNRRCRPRCSVVTLLDLENHTAIFKSSRRIKKSGRIVITQNFNLDYY